MIIGRKATPIQQRSHPGTQGHQTSGNLATLEVLRYLYLTAKAETTCPEVIVSNQWIRLILSDYSNLENSVMGMNGFNASERHRSSCLSRFYRDLLAIVDKGSDALVTLFLQVHKIYQNRIVKSSMLEDPARSTWKGPKRSWWTVNADAQVRKMGAMDCPGTRITLPRKPS